ncbi:MAG: two-component system, NtrC family, sensor kinase [Bryobacterales bacterium]|jgi:signal transduction histidine kinase|nr:two-component system, NtrC family, sensor kinase [Bryobacterales bacterium]
MTAADIRHSLRTPLNHIVGFGEMLQEETGEDASLRTLIEEARQMVALIQNTSFQNSDAVSDEEMTELRRSLLPWVQNLETGIPAGLSADLGKIRSAVSLLADFVHNRPDSIQRLTKSAPETAPSRSHGGKGNLLIVDDNAANRDILKRHLERQEYGVSTACDGQECLRLLESGTFELVLLDVLMPVMDGFEVLTQMRANPAIRETPVVMISALDETAGVVRCIQMGAEDYLTKPFDPVLLSARIGASLEKKRLRDEERRRAHELQLALDELRRTQAQLVVQDKLASLGAMTAGIAHEIKNPLNFVTNFAAAAVDIVKEIRAKAVLPESSELLNQLEQYVTKIDEHGKRADRIVRSMLMHSRGKSGTPEPVDVNSMLSDCLNLAYHGLRAQDRQFNVRFETEFDTSLPRVRGIPQELSRVFLNVINNACYAAYERKKREGPSCDAVIGVQTKADVAAAEIRIRDNGFGIPAEALPKVFDPFFTTKPAGTGTGLGLSLSHEIVVHGHNGTLRAESEAGHGAEFIIRLPLERTGKAS